MAANVERTNKKPKLAIIHVFLKVSKVARIKSALKLPKLAPECIRFY